MSAEHFEMFFSCIAGIYRGIQKLKMTFAGGLDIKAVQVFWIYLLREHPEGLTASELAEASQTARSLVSREITDLIERGLLDTDPQMNKRRYGWKFHLTKKGEELAGRISQIAWNVQTAVNKDISQEDLAVFYRVLTTLCQNFTNLQAFQDRTTGGRP